MKNKLLWLFTGKGLLTIYFVSVAAIIFTFHDELLINDCVTKAEEAAKRQEGE